MALQRFARYSLGGRLAPARQLRRSAFVIAVPILCACRGHVRPAVRDLRPVLTIISERYALFT